MTDGYFYASLIPELGDKSPIPVGEVAIDKQTQLDFFVTDEELHELTSGKETKVHSVSR